MYIDLLVLENYRNHQQLTLNLSPTINIILAGNAQGKSNLIEAIYLLSSAKSPRAHQTRELINFQSSLARIQAKIRNQQSETKVEVILDHAQPKQTKINNSTKVQTRDVRGRIRTVLFSPEDIQIMKGGPHRRRAFLNHLIGQIEPQHPFLTHEYQKILRQRTALLKKSYSSRQPPGDLIRIWDQKLADVGTKIAAQRLTWVKKLAPAADSFYRKISDHKSSLKLKYTINFPLNKNEFFVLLKENRNKEIERGQTLFGPHRDDLKISSEGKDLRVFGSQGEQKTASLALKLGQLQLTKQETGEKPILLLDDVMSEIDKKKRQNLLDTINIETQTIITTTDLEFFPSWFTEKAKLIKISNKQERETAN